jgi:hypothetical protein
MAAAVMMMDPMIERWLTDRISYEAAEQRFQRFANSPQWRAFLGNFQTGDELWNFRSPPATWPRKVGAAGIAIVRDGRVVAHFTPMRS